MAKPPILQIRAAAPEDAAAITAMQALPGFRHGTLRQPFPRVEDTRRWLGLRRLELTVFTDNAPAIALYRRAGFVHEGTHRAYALRAGRLVDAHFMARLVGESCEAE